MSFRVALSTADRKTLLQAFEDTVAQLKSAITKAGERGVVIEDLVSALNEAEHLASVSRKRVEQESEWGSDELSAGTIAKFKASLYISSKIDEVAAQEANRDNMSDRVEAALREQAASKRALFADDRFAVVDASQTLQKWGFDRWSGPPLASRDKQ